MRCIVCSFTICYQIMLSFGSYHTMDTGSHLLLEVKFSFMDDGLGKIKIIPDHFTASPPIVDSTQNVTSSISRPRTDNYLRLISSVSHRKVM